MAWIPGSCTERGLEAWEAGRSSPPHPSTHTYSFIPSTNTHLSGPVCARHCVGQGGCQGREVNEAVAEALGEVGALWTRIPLQPEQVTVPSPRLSGPLYNKPCVFSFAPKTPTCIEHPL